MENYPLNDRVISDLQDDFKGEELPVVVECAQKVAQHLQRNMDLNKSSASVDTLVERQSFVQQIITYCGISGN